MVHLFQIKYMILGDLFYGFVVMENTGFQWCVMLSRIFITSLES